MWAPRCLTPEECLAHLERRDDAPPAEDVIKHLEACNRCQAMMSEAARAMTEEGPPAPHVLAAGEQLAGRFTIVRFLARGGMGEVYEAFDTALRERVALKTLTLTTLDDGRSVDLLLAEVRLARRVTHRNVCRILELGLYRKRGESIPFLTMEFLEGETLGARIKRVGQLPSSDVGGIAQQLTAGLAAIHEANIVHRDFKSDNVMLVQDAPDQERAVVMDFGLARALTGPMSSLRVVGTPPYMAPEQLEGKPATPAFDIYALGVVMFEMLTGRLPRATRSGLKGLPRAWNDIVLRCLEHEPGLRFANVEQVAAAVARQARPISSRARIVAVVAGVAAAAIVGLVAQQLSRRPTSPASTAPAAAAHLPAAPSVPAAAATPPAAANAITSRPAPRDRPPPRKAAAAKPAAVVEQPPVPAPPPPPAPAQKVSDPPAADELFVAPPPRTRHRDDVINPF